MIIAKYIGDLLYDYECVVIPGLGGFIINDKPTRINYNTHYFKPPFREVMFNPYLRTNDGLLLNYIAKEENLTYQEAKRKMDTFSIACQRALDNGKQIRFEKVGTIRKDDNDKVVFKQDTNINYNPNSFGLTSFISPAVHTVSSNEKIKEAINKVKANIDKPASTSKEKVKRTDRHATNKTQKHLSGDRIVVAKRRSPYRSQFYFILLLLVGMLVGWGVMNKKVVADYYAQYGTKVPVFYNNSGSYIANNVEIIPLKSLSENASALWLVQLFKKDEVKGTSLINDNLTFDAKPISKTEEAVQPNNGKEDISKDVENPKEAVASDMEDVPITEEPEQVINTEVNKDLATVSPDNAEAETPVSYNNGIRTNLDKVTTTLEPETKAITESVPSFSFFIIAGSFKNHSNAVKLVKQLQAKGFESIITGTNKYGMTRVAYAGFSNMQEAAQQLSSIRQQQNPSAWILRK